MQRLKGSLSRIGHFLLAMTMLTVPAYAVTENEGHANGMLSVGLTKGPFTEAVNPVSNPENLNSQISSLERYYLKWAWAWDAGSRLALRINRGTYQISDQDFPGTIHQRTETGLVGGNQWRVSLFGGEADLGFGYCLQAFQVDNTSTAPGTDPRFLFSAWQLYHGPTLMENFRRELVGPMGIALDVEWTPYAFANFADNRLSLPWLTAVRVAPRFVFWDERLALGYYYERTTGVGYNRETSGVLASLSMTGI